MKEIRLKDMYLFFVCFWFWVKLIKLFVVDYIEEWEKLFCFYLVLNKIDIVSYLDGIDLRYVNF